ncbi:protein LURP-one-related 6-like [Impatiens glandulifera]|uniref:protein LURP-one-related 6-like n=1 Tax=Impatiens glandulifera TaxID=253017 RepID=UPI001FB0E8E3|nr:protein LURP-one-related 6-like [Impatiens glandulifera]
MEQIVKKDSPAVYVVRRRPRVVGGGGIVVTESSTQKVVFKVEDDGCLNKKRSEVMLRDCDGKPLLLLRREKVIGDAVRMSREWKGYAFGYNEDSRKVVFRLKQPHSWLVRNGWCRPITVSAGQSDCCGGWDFQVKGFFKERACAIVDSMGNALAQVIGMEKMKKWVSNDIYSVAVRSEADSTFVFAIISLLDHIDRMSL